MAEVGRGEDCKDAAKDGLSRGLRDELEGRTAAVAAAATKGVGRIEMEE